MAEWFPTASELRARQVKSTTVQLEIMGIQQGIMEANDANLIETTISNTLMTSGANAVDYYNVWKTLEDDRLKDLEMAEVMNYFIRLGYSITRTTNSDTGNTFLWTIKW